MAGYTINRIPESQSVFLTSVPSLWSVSGSSATIGIDAQISKYQGQGSLRAVLSENESVVFNEESSGFTGISTSISMDIDDLDDSVTSFVWVKSSKPVIINFQVDILYPSGTVAMSPYASKSRSVSISSGEWTLVRLYDLPELKDNGYIYPVGFRLTVESIQGDSNVDLNISSPCIYGTLEFINNPAIVDILKKLPEFIRQLDVDYGELPYQLARFLEMATIHTGEIYALLDEFIYSDISEGKNELDTSTLSTLVDPIVVKREYMFWLAQFSGTKLLNPTTGLTPWANLPKLPKPGEEEETTTWEALDLIDDDDVDLEEAVIWQALQDYNTEPVGLDEFLRWQISTSYYGRNAGTQEALVEAVKRVLIDTKTVEYEVLEPFDWTIRITTLKTETPDSSLVDIGGSVAEIVELLEPARPAGFKIIHRLA
jgi:hypothetical protein